MRRMPRLDDRLVLLTTLLAVMLLAMRMRVAAFLAACAGVLLLFTLPPPCHCCCRDGGQIVSEPYHEAGWPLDPNATPPPSVLSPSGGKENNAPIKEVMSNPAAANQNEATPDADASPVEPEEVEDDDPWFSV